MGSGAGTSDTSTSGSRLRRILLASGIAFATTMAAGATTNALPLPAPPEPPDGETVTYECASEVPTPAEAILGGVTPTDDPTTIPADGDVVRTWDFGAEFDPTTFVQTITVDDTTAPVFTAAPEDETIVRGPIPAAAPLAVTDNCDDELVASEEPVDVTDPVEVVDPESQIITRTWSVTDTAGNTATATQIITVIPVGADLSITATPLPTSVVAGNDDEVVYTIDVTNNGPDAATNVVVTTASIPDATTTGCTNDPNGAASCSLGDLADGASISYTVTLDEPAGAAGSIVRTWEVTSDTADPVATNNTVDTTVGVTARAAMTVTASVVVTGLPPETTTTTTGAQATSALAAGDPVEITITVGNDGPSDATDATVAATFTNSISSLQIVNDGLYTCSIVSQVLSCTLATHAVGQDVVITLSGALTSSSTDIFVGPVTVDSAVSDAASTSSILVTVIPPTTTTTTVPETTTTVVDTTTIPTTTIPATTIVVIVPTTVAPAGGGAIPATGSDNGNVIRASLIALLAGIAAVVIARRRPELVAALRPSSWGSGRPADLPTRHVKSNGVSTVIEEPTRRDGRH